MHFSTFALLVSSAAATSYHLGAHIKEGSFGLAGLLSHDGFELATVASSQRGKATCTSGFVTVDASTTQNIHFEYQTPKNQSQVTETFLEFVTPGSGFTEQIMGGKSNVSGQYKIGATLCTPADGTKPSSVQLLTHGVGFDRSYWDVAPGYSYVDVAAENGYATFAYDRLGVGLSDKPDPIQVIQAPLEVDIARALAANLRSGSFGGTSFTSVVGVGHSFGSVITQAVTAQFPESLDAAILTGFSVYMAGQPVFIQGINLALANHNQPLRFGALNNDFLVSDTIISNQIGFFKAPGFDPAILQLSEATKQTVTIGELFTISAVGGPAKRWNKPVAVVNGVADLPFCFGNCTYPTNLAQAVKPALYATLADENFGAYLAPGTGHGLNLHYSAGKSYDYIQKFISSHGITA